MSDDPEKWADATKLVRGGLVRSRHGETAEALYLNSGFVYPDGETAAARFAGEDEGFIYSRYGNPTVRMFEERLALFEGAEECFATASGMAAMFASLACQVGAGDRVVASRALFGSCYHILSKILPRFGVEVTFVDGPDLAQWEEALAPGVSCVFLETPSNPLLELIDIEAVAGMVHEAGGRLIVDNVFASPILQKPFTLGADIVAYSGTKHMDGQGRVLGGAVLSSAEFRKELLEPFLRHTGPAMSPFNAWVLLKGLETLALRMRHQTENTLAIAERLEADSRVARVHYPFLDSHPQKALAERQMTGGGTVLSFEIEGGREAAFAFLKRLELIDISNNLGDSKSLVTHPASTTHRSLTDEERAAVGITEDLLRLSIGFEDPEDLMADLDRALG